MSTTAKKLPSGKWRCQAYGEKVDGKYTRKSFTADTKHEAEFLAAQYELEKKSRVERNTFLTFGEALDEMIEMKEPVLSPNTYREYKKAAERDYDDIRNVKLYDLSQADIQRHTSEYARTHSAKSTRNNHGLITSVFKSYRPDFAIHTTLPQKKRPDYYIPNESDIKKLMDAVRGTKMELPVLLAAFGPMRRAEICALKKSDVNGCIVHVHAAIARTYDGELVEKQPKTYAGDRYITFPDFIGQKLSEVEGPNITDLTPNKITGRFGKLITRIGLPKFRFHDLRHYSASILHVLGMPDAYIMERGGWESDRVLKSVYRHTLEDQRLEMTKRVNDFFQHIACDDSAPESGAPE